MDHALSIKPPNPFIISAICQLQIDKILILVIQFEASRFNHVSDKTSWWCVPRFIQFTMINFDNLIYFVAFQRTRFFIVGVYLYTQASNQTA